MRRWLAHGQAVRSLAFAPDGRSLLSAGGDARLRAWSVAGDLLWDVGLTPEFRTTAVLAFSPDGGLLAVGEDGGVRLRDPATGAEIRHLAAWGPARDETSEGASAVTFRPDGSLLVALDGDEHTPSDVYRFAPPSWRRETLLANCSGDSEGGIHATALTPDGRLLAEIDGGGLKVWDLGRRVVVLSCGPATPAVAGRGALAFSRCGRFLGFAGTLNPTFFAFARVCVLEVGRLAGEVGPATPGFRAVPGAGEADWRPEGDVYFIGETESVAFGAGALFTGDRHGVVIAHDPPTGAARAAWDWGGGAMWRLAVSPDGCLAAAGTRTGEVILWDVE